MSANILTDKKKEEIIQKIEELGGDGVTKCIQCGACASICPVAQAGFPLFCRMLIRKLQTGHLEEIIEDPSSWACQACNRCTEICPRDAKPSEIVFAFRRIQAEELAISTSAFTPLMNFYEKGHSVYNEASRESREKVGLPPEPPTALNDEKALKELQTLLEDSPMADLGIF